MELKYKMKVFKKAEIMKIVRILLLSFVLSIMSAPQVFAIKGVIATPEDINNLKKALRERKVLVGQTRLKDFRNLYGEAPEINSNEKSITYNYGDLKIEFEVKRLWKDWGYDSFMSPAYTKKINDLRYNLESKKLVGENITFTKIRKDYDEPTESHETSEDGGVSIYYFGDIKLTFENVIVVKSWKGEKLNAEEAPKLPPSTMKEPPKENPKDKPKDNSKTKNDDKKKAEKDVAKEPGKEKPADATNDVAKDTAKDAVQNDTKDKAPEPAPAADQDTSNK